MNLLLSIQDAYVTFGGKPLFDGLSFNIHDGDKICLVGKNGAGKTTLMHMITGTRELDGGKRFQVPSMTVGYLQQESHPETDQTVFDYIFSGLEEKKQIDDYKYMVSMVSEPLELHPEDKMDKLSGGQLRRAALARALVEEPDILLLDEPTNHLDLGAIEWLEDYLKYYRGALLCVSHDKTFLNNISNKVFWLDRGNIRVCPKGFSHFDEWSGILLEQEARELEKRKRLVAHEIEWASQGVKARRKRNMLRVENMKKERAKLKADSSSFNQTMRKISLEQVKGDPSSKIVAEFYKVGKTFDEDSRKKIILDDFNLRILRGDRIGVLGKNGSGKTTFLKLLIDELTPDTGKVKLARNLDIAYFDQKRRDLNNKFSLWKTLCPQGGDYVKVAGKDRHVCGYLKDFLFDPKSAKDLVGTLSGGQRNRLMLARVLASPGDLLILDEPTNDLDMDTLEMLEDILSKYKGTLIVVSHDRDFLDQTVTKILAFEGGGEVKGCIGGYTDYLEASGKKKPVHDKKPEEIIVKAKPEKEKNKLSNKQQYELKKLPSKIAKLEKEIKSIQEQLADRELYMNNPETFDKISKRIGLATKELEMAEIRWLELEEYERI